MTTIPSKTFAPGVYQIPAYEYHASVGLSNSFMSRAYEASWLHAKYDQDHPEEPTTEDAKRTLIVGSAIHTAILEPDRFEASYIVGEDCHKKTQKGEECGNPGKILSEGRWYCGVHGKNKERTRLDRIPLRAKEWQQIVGMQESVWSHPFARQLLETPEPVESSAYWIDDATGVLCRARRDKMAVAHGFMMDLKSSESAHARDFSRSVWNYGYHRQGPWYLKGNALADPDHPVAGFAFCVFEKKPPHGCQLFALTERAMERGWEQLTRLVEQYAECLRTGEWPCYSKIVEPIDIPDFGARVVAKEAQAAGADQVQIPSDLLERL